jgi:hypothetical protein
MRNVFFPSLAALAAAAALGAPGCGHGGSPSGASSPAANFGALAHSAAARHQAGAGASAGNGAGGASSSGQTPSGGGATSGAGGAGAPAIRLVGWTEADVMPGGGQDMWLFFTDNGLDPNSIDLLVNGNGMGNTAFQNLGPSSIGNGTGQWVILSPMPPPNATLQITATDANGNAVSSNILATKTGPFAAQNVPSFFVTTSPQDGATQTGTTPMLDWLAAQAVTTYNVVVLELTIDPTTQQEVISDAPVCVEVAPAGGGAQTFTVGGTAVVTYSNTALANPGHYAWHVVALDQDGWGVGTTIDVAGFNAVGASNQPTKQVSDTWPEFDTN